MNNGANVVAVGGCERAVARVRHPPLVPHEMHEQNESNVMLVPSALSQFHVVWALGRSKAAM